MSYSSAAEGLLRRKYLEEMYDRMTDEEKKLFIQMTMQNKSRDEILQALAQQNQKIDEVSRKIGNHPFATDLLSNVVGNGITDGLVWLGKNLFKKI